MKYVYTLLSSLIFLIVCTSAFALEVPPLSSRVNDYAAILSTETKARVEQNLSSFESQESTQIVVLTVKSLESESIENFGIKVAEAWKIGAKGKDNGVILIVAADDRKIRIETGRGLEGVLTDLAASIIIRKDIAPYFKRGDYDGGILNGISIIQKTVTGEYKPDEKPAKKGRSPLHPAPLTIIIAAAVGVIFAGAFSKYLGGITGAVASPFILNFFMPSVSMIPLIIMSLFGFVAGLVLAAIFSGGGGGGGPFFPGGFYGGGFSGGGFSDGGGDSGFSGGGGDFGGGGASGDW